MPASASHIGIANGTYTHDVLPPTLEAPPTLDAPPLPDVGQLGAIQVHVVVPFDPQTGPTTVPSGHLTRYWGLAPVQVHAPASVGQARIAHLHVPSVNCSQYGPPVLPSVHRTVGDSGEGPLQAQVPASVGHLKPVTQPAESYVN